MKRSAVIQCRRCQKFAHTANGCQFIYRCVQCATSHDYGSCPRAANKNLPLACVNCTPLGYPAEHTANHLSQCSYFKQHHPALYNKFMDSSIKKKDVPSRHPVSTFTPLFHDDMSRPAKSNNGKTRQPQTNQPTINPERPPSNKNNDFTSNSFSRSNINVPFNVSSNRVPQRPSGRSSSNNITDERVSHLTHAIASLIIQYLHEY